MPGVGAFAQPDDPRRQAFAAVEQLGHGGVFHARDVTDARAGKVHGHRALIVGIFRLPHERKRRAHVKRGPQSLARMVVKAGERGFLEQAPAGAGPRRGGQKQRRARSEEGLEPLAAVGVFHASCSPVIVLFSLIQPSSPQAHFMLLVLTRGGGEAGVRVPAQVGRADDLDIPAVAQDVHHEFTAIAVGDFKLKAPVRQPRTALF